MQDLGSPYMKIALSPIQTVIFPGFSQHFIGSCYALSFFFDVETGQVSADQMSYQWPLLSKIAFLISKSISY
jgi:hypothetical protein